MSRSNVSQHFLETLYSLGWPLEISKQNGWTGLASTSYKMPCKEFDRRMGKSSTLKKINEFKHFR